MIPELEFHDIANWFPVLDDASLRELADDIKAHGLRLPIAIYEGKVLDGRNRYLACQRVNVDPVTEDVNPEDPVAYVLSRNLHRRHLDSSQRAMIAAKVASHLESQAKARQTETQIKDGLPPVVEKCAPPGKQAENGKSRDKAAKALCVSNRTVDKAKKVREQGTPELRQAVESGKLDVTKAARLAGLPKDVQDTLLTDAKANNWTPRVLMDEAKRLAPKSTEPPKETKKADSPTLQELKALWKKACKGDKQAFRDWIKE